MTFSEQYHQLLRALMLFASTETNERTGVDINFLPSGWMLSLDLHRGVLPLINGRKTFPRTAAIEVAWYLTGDKSLSMLREYNVASIWEPFADENDLVQTAYGYRWRDHFFRDQLRAAVEALRADPTNRRVYVTAWDPNQDGMAAEQANTPCPIGFTLTTHELDGQRHLNMNVYIRSSDVFVGLPYDVMGHAMLQGVLAASLGMECGMLNLTLSHPHLYACHREHVGEYFNCSANAQVPEMPLVMWEMPQVEVDIDGFITQYANMAGDVTWPEFHCRPELVK